MLTLPIWMITLLSEFAPAIYGITTWYKVEVLVAGAILATGKRTVRAILRVMRLSQARNYAMYHHGLWRAVWSGLEVSAILLRLLLKTFDSGGPLVFGIDETIERRRGAKIAAKGIYRDGVRSSQSHCVKARGLRWVSVMWLAHIPFGQRIWALPFLTALAPSARYWEPRGRPAKTLPTAALVAPSPLGCGGRQSLCCPGFFAALSDLAPTGDRHHPLALGCGVVRACATLQR